MIIEEGEDLFGQQGQECACCGVVVFDFPFISWDFSDNGCIARVAIHPKSPQVCCEIYGRVGE